jgi:hypothetical protein
MSCPSLDAMAREWTAAEREEWLSKPAGKRPKKGPAPATVQRDAEACALRAQGWSYRQIAARLGIDHRTAFMAVQRNLDRVPVESAAEMRQLQGAALDADEAALQRIIDDPPHVVSGNGVVTSEINWDAVTRAVDARTKLRARRARMFGLDAPTVQVRASASIDELEARLQRAYGQLAAQARAEALQAIERGQDMPEAPEDDPGASEADAEAS